ncbi:11S globulin seed storage protein 2-like [Wolffia australiana]
MEVKVAKKAIEGDGGAFFVWSAEEMPILAASQKGAAKLVLRERGLAMPFYSDSAKIAYVLEGSGRAGVVLPEASEKVVAIREGDAIALPFGTVTWWFNSSKTDLTILFLGDTSNAHSSGAFTDFSLTGSRGIFTGFSPEFAGRAFDLSPQVAARLVTSQPADRIVKLEEPVRLPDPTEGHREGLVLNCEEAPLDVDVEGGGRVVVVSGKNLPLLESCGFGGDLVKLDGGAMCSPGFSSDSAYQVTYIAKGSGRAQVVGPDGKLVLDARVSAGSLFIVPRFFVVSKIADAAGMQWFSIVTTPDPVFSHLAGKTSVWKALSPLVLQASFNVPADAVAQFGSKRTSEAIFFPPPAL